MRGPPDLKEAAMIQKSTLVALTQLFALTFATALIGCNPQEAEVAAQIDQRNREIERNIAANDAIKLVDEYYAADVAVLVPPGHEFVSGRNNIIEFWRQDLETAITVQLQTTRIELQGDLAVEVGTYLFQVDTPNGPQPQPGKYSVTFRKQSDGKWKAVIDMWAP
jgi:ketosteroid isomerase-like protein